MDSLYFSKDDFMDFWHNKYLSIILINYTTVNKFYVGNFSFLSINY